MRNSVGLLGDKIDTRFGGYVAGEGSKHHSGIEYTCINPDVEVAPLPGWLLTVLETAEGANRRKRGKDNTLITEGQRNDQLFREACSIRGKGGNETDILASVAARNEASCDPPLADEELQRIARSAASYPAGANEKPPAKNSYWWFRADVNEICKDPRIALLTDYQFGWFWWLKIRAWTCNGYLPNRPEILAKLANAGNKRKFFAEMHAVMAFFDVTDDETQIFDPELVEYWQEQRRKTEQAKAAGKASAERRRTQRNASEEPQQ